MTRLTRLVASVLTAAAALGAALAIGAADAGAGVKATGTYEHSIAIEVPRFHGIEPAVALSYDANGGNDLAGFGWRLDASSYVVRSGPRGGAPAYDGTDVFRLDGVELIPCSKQPMSASPSCTTGGTHSAKFESYQRIRKETENWEIWEKDGTHLVYEPQHAMNPASLGRPPYRWALARVEDTRGNAVAYGYLCQGLVQPECYLDSITYARPSGPIGTSVQFHYSQKRPDPYTYATGSTLASVRWRLRSIEVRAAGSLLRAYELEYNDRANGILAQKDVQPHALIGVQQFGSDASLDALGDVSQGATPPLPKTIFKQKGSGAGWSYADQSPPFALAPDKGGVAGAGTWTADTSLPWDDWHGARVRWFPGDFDADGRDDFLGTYIEKDPNGIERIQLRVAHSNLNGTYTFAEMRTTWLYGSHGNPDWRVMPGDANGDGRTDVMAVLYDAATNTHVFETALARADWVPGQPPFSLAPSYRSRISGGDPRNRWFTGDANGDGSSDFMVALRAGPSPIAGFDHALLLVALSNGNGSYSELPPDETTWSFEHEDDPYWFTGDANGDGRADFLRVTEEHHQTEPLETAGLGYAFSNGDGSFTETWRDTFTNWRGSVALPDWAVLADAGNDLVQSGDFNGDGRVDLAFMNGMASSPTNPRPHMRTHVALSGGRLITDDTLTIIPDVQNAHWSLQHNTGDFPNQWTSGDVNGDGATDLVVLRPHSYGSTTSVPTGDKSGSVWPTTTRVVKLISNKDGTFDVKPSYNTGWAHDCWNRGRVCPEGPKFQAFAADASGDGRADLMYAGYRETAGNELTSLRVDVSPLTNGDGRHWLQADVSGDGVRDDVYVQYTNPGIRVHTSLGRAAGASGPAGLETDDLLPSFDEPNMGVWLHGDVGGPSGGPDGRADLVYPYYSGNGIRVFTLLSKGNGKWEAKPDPSGTFAWATPYRDTFAWRLMDVDGDGRGDLVHASQRGLGIGVHTLLSNGNGSWTGVDEPHAAGFGMADTPNWKQADVNGDGRADLVNVLFAGSPNQVVVTLLATGGGRWLAKAHVLALPVTDTADWQVAELNGDGNTDLINVASSTPGIDLDTLLSHGDGMWDYEPAQAVPDTGMPSGGATRQWRVLDLNDDGLDDLARVDLVAVDALLNRHEGWTAERNDHEVRKNLGATIPDLVGWRAADDDGDGLDDLVFARPSGGSITLVALRSTFPDRRLVEHSNGLGTTTSVVYRSSPGTNASLPVGTTLSLVDAVTVTAGLTYTTVRYEYEGGGWSYDERRFLGFAKRVEAEGTTRIVTEYAQIPACTGEPRRETLRDSAGSTIRVTSFEHARATTPSLPPPYTCLLTRRGESECEGTASCRFSSSLFEHDVYGNVTRVIEEGRFVDADRDGADDDLRDNRARVTTYVPNKSDYIVGLPASKHLWDYSHGATLLSQTEYVYDGNAVSSNAPTRGDLKVEEVWNDKTGAVLRTRYDYDGHGNLKRVTLPSGRWSSIDYDPSYELYPVTRCNALQHCVSHQWDYRLGKPKLDVDANGERTSYGYDALGRLKRVDFPDGGCLDYTYLDVGTPASQRVRQVACDRVTGSDGPAAGLEREHYFDGQGRLWRETRSGGYTRELSYADAGPLVAASTTWFASGEKPKTERYEYDAAKRLRFVRHLDGSSAETQYRVGAEVQIDELGHERVFFRDALGRIEKVREQVTEQGTVVDHDTTYVYDLLDRLTRLVDAAGNVSTTEWNSLGHQLRKCDPDSGCWQYGYDDDGLLEWRIDARGQKVGFHYDAAGRLDAKENYSGGAVKNRARFHYDRDPVSGARLGSSIGQLTRVEDPGGGSEQYSYDSMGRVLSTEKCVGSRCLTWATSYDALGRLKQIVYPDGELVDHLYDGAGRLEAVGPYATNIRYDSNDRVNAMELGNGTTASFDYHPARDWLEHQKVEDPSGASLFAADYGFDAGAHLRTLTVSNPVQTSLSLDYDELGRLLSVSGSRNEQFQYDALGNITRSSSGGVYDYSDPAHVHAVTDVETGPSKGSYAYDANGSMLSGAGRTFTWDDDGLPTEITTASGTTTFAYDALGSRVEKSGPSGTTIYFGPLAEHDTNGNLVKHYYAGSQLIARSDPTGTTYLHQDLVGSTRLVTDANASVVERDDFEAFGALAGATGKGAGGPAVRDLAFAGHRADDETGLIYMNARYYDPVLARFVSADTVVPDALNPQALNRYSYAYNDPFGYADPSGHEPEAWIKKREGGPKIQWNVDLLPRRSGPPPDVVVVEEARPTPFDRSRTSWTWSRNPGWETDSMRAQRQREFDLKQKALDAYGKTWDDIIKLQATSDRLKALETMHSSGLAAPASLLGDTTVEKEQFAAFAANVGAFSPAAAPLAKVLSKTPSLGSLVMPEKNLISQQTDGPFSIRDWKGYPEWAPKPAGPFILLSGAAYKDARAAATAANNALRATGPFKGMEFHEVQPVKFSGSPTDPANKLVTPASHHRSGLTPWWNALQRSLERRQK